MHGKGLRALVIIASVAAAGAAALVWPLLHGPSGSPHTLVETGSTLTPEANDWLVVGDGRDPAVWLSEHLDAVDPSRAATLLGDLAAAYEETPRMIANRAAQIAAETAGDPPADRLLDDLSWSTQSTRSFGAVAQNYLVLRRLGHSHASAIETLHAALGEQG